MKLWNFKNEIKQTFIEYHYASINDPVYTTTQAYKHIERSPPPLEQTDQLVIPLRYGITEAEPFEAVLQMRSSWPYPFPNDQVINLPFISKFSQLALIGNGKVNRNYPSGGGQYYVKVHYLLNKDKVSEDLGDFSVYELDMDHHRLLAVGTTDWNEIQAAYIQKISITTAQFAIVLSVDLVNISKKYSDISYKLVQQEAGHIGQNIQLVGNYMGIKTLPLGGFYDLPLSNIIGGNQTAIYTFLLG